MTDVINYLKSFNRKERFILLHEVLGFQGQSFRLGEAFCQSLSNCLSAEFGQKRIEVPEDAFVAMDYHLDWLQLALWLTDQRHSKSTIRNDKLFCANQEDIDLLVAFSDLRTTHLVLIEAKGDTGWTNRQMRHKAKRLEWIFRVGRPGRGKVTPHFIMMSPRPSLRLNTTGWPDWMVVDGEPKWLELELPAGLLKATRCRKDGTSDKSDGYLKIRSI